MKAQMEIVLLTRLRACRPGGYRLLVVDCCATSTCGGMLRHRTVVGNPAYATHQPLLGYPTATIPEGRAGTCLLRTLCCVVGNHTSSSNNPATLTKIYSYLLLYPCKNRCMYFLLHWSLFWVGTSKKSNIDSLKLSTSIYYLPYSTNVPFSKIYQLSWY